MSAWIGEGSSPTRLTAGAARLRVGGLLDEGDALGLEAKPLDAGEETAGLDGQASIGEGQLARGTVWGAGGLKSGLPSGARN